MTKKLPQHVPISDVPISDVPISDVPISDVPISIPISDVPIPDVPISDVPISDVPISGDSATQGHVEHGWGIFLEGGQKRQLQRPTGRTTGGVTKETTHPTRLLTPEGSADFLARDLDPGMHLGFRFIMK